MKTAADILRSLGLPLPPEGKRRYYTACPRCSATRSKAHRNLKCLGVTIDDKGVKVGCNHCEWTAGGYFNGKANGGERLQQFVVSEFPYQDETGKVLSVVERREYRKRDANGKAKKTIKQKRPDPKHPGKWLWNVDGVQVVPYRLPQLIEAIAAGHPILIVEGEPKVDLLRSWGVAATCNAGGSGKWKPEHSKFLTGADVVLVPDNDDPGWQHVNAVGASLSGTANRIRVLVLPGLPPKGDVVDWAKAGGTREQLSKLLDAAPDWKPPSADELNDEKAKAKAREDELIDALAKTEGLDYARQRKAAAKDLGVSARDIDEQVRARREDAQVAPLYGHWIVEPWPEPVDGDSLLRDIIKRIHRHVVISPDGALVIALWLMLSWVHDEVATHSPILNINSAEPESGKSTTMGLIAFLMPKCIASVEVSEAAIYRAIKRWQPSFCFDEFDSVLADDDKAALRSVINSGHTRGQGVLRCIGEDKVPELFSTFAAKCIGMVGRKLPPATLSRCIFVELRRCRKDETFEKFAHVDDAELADLRGRLRRWAIDNQDTLRVAQPSIPDELQNRRADNWRLQFAIADLCDGAEGYAEKARAAATRIEGKTDSRTIGVRLLTDIKALFGVGGLAPHTSLTSALIVGELVADPEGPWAEFTRGKPLTQGRLARMLSVYGIASQTIWVEVNGEKTSAKGYRRHQFDDVWASYVP